MKLVHDENIIEFRDTKRLNVPWLFNNWTEQARKNASEYMSKEAKFFPRDEKGKFIKC